MYRTVEAGTVRNEMIGVLRWCWKQRTLELRKIER